MESAFFALGCVILLVQLLEEHFYYWSILVNIGDIVQWRDWFRFCYVWVQLSWIGQLNWSVLGWFGIELS